MVSLPSMAPQVAVSIPVSKGEEVPGCDVTAYVSLPTCIHFLVSG